MSAQELAAIEKEEKEREFRTSHEHLGSKLLTDEEEELIAAKQKEVTEKIEAARRALKLKCAKATMYGPHDPKPELQRRVMRPAWTNKDEPPPWGVLPETSWDVTGTDAWQKREGTLRRFVSIVSDMIVRRRAQKRLDKIKRRLKGAKSRADVERIVAADQDLIPPGQSTSSKKMETAVAEKKKKSEEKLPTLLDGMPTPGRVDLSSFPSLTVVAFPRAAEKAEAKSTTSASPVHFVAPTFDDWDFVDIQPVDPVAVALDTSVHLLPNPTPPYFPAELKRDVRTGAEDEGGVRAPRGMDFQVTIESPQRQQPAWRSEWLGQAVESEFATMPPELSKPPRPRKRTSRGDVAYQMPPEVDEASLTWLLEPRPHPRPKTHAAAVAECRGPYTIPTAYASFPSPSSKWRPRRERRPSALDCLKDQYALRGWNVRQKWTDVAALSESESDDDSAFSDLVIPTIDACAALLKAPATDDPQEESVFDDDEPTAAVISDIPRDRARLELYRNHVAMRRKAQALLPTRYNAIASAIREPTLRDRIARPTA